MDFARYCENVEIQKGYSSYSILLIPEYGWFEHKGIQFALDFFKRFSDFGNILGDKHLSCWFYRNKGVAKDSPSEGRGSYIELYAAISGHISSVEEVEKYVKSSSLFKNPEGGSYDAERARLICTSYGLDYKSGPYIAFFSSYPVLPYYDIEGFFDKRISKNIDNFTEPELIMKFGGLNLSRSIELMDELEQQILRQKIGPTKIKIKQLSLHLAQWCEEHKDSLLEIIKSVSLVSISPKA